MGSRLWMALLLLAAVVAGHGAATCLAAAPVSQHGFPSMGAVPLFSPVAAVAVDGAAIGSAHHGGAVVAQGPGADAAGPAAPWHDLHVVAACLAALLAGIAALRALTQLRSLSLPLGRGSPEPAGRGAGRTWHPPAADLSILCLLRI